MTDPRDALRTDLVRLVSVHPQYKSMAHALLDILDDGARLEREKTVLTTEIAHLSGCVRQIRAALAATRGEGA